MIVDYSNFASLDIRVGVIERAEVFEKARKPAYKLWIDFGAEIGQLKSSAQITDFYKPDELIGRQVVAVVNFGDKQIADFKSQCLVLGVYTPEGVALLSIDKKVENGARIG